MATKKRGADEAALEVDTKRAAEKKTAAKKGGGDAKRAAAKPQEFETVTVGNDVLDGTPERVVKLVVGVNRSSAVRRALERRGFDAQARREGLELLTAVSGLSGDAQEVEDESGGEGAVRDAAVEIDGADEPVVRLVRAVLTHKHPAVAKRVLKGVEPAKGSGSVLVLRTVLDRLDAVEKEAGEDGRAAIARLAQRGLDAGERARLRGLLRVVEGAGLVAVDAKSVDAEEKSEAQSDAEYRRALRALRAWFEEWSEVARLCVKRRDHLLLLGLAERHVSAGKGGAEEEEEEKEGAKAEKPAGKK